MINKATRLQKLSKIVSVPQFVVFCRNDEIKKYVFDDTKQYIVRSVSKLEDQKKYSHAGQFQTIGPIDFVQIVDAVNKIFLDDLIENVIVQEFVKGVSGVAFCFDKDNLYVEFSKQSEGVTSGLCNPFVVLLPSKINRYKLLQKKLQEIVENFGPCDVEFINIKNPQFVQVRPITKQFEIDTDAVKIKMKLQELPEYKWIENDISHTIAEHGNDANKFIYFYLRELTKNYEKIFNKKIEISQNPIVQIGGQYFVSQKFINAINMSYIDIFKFLIFFVKEQKALINPSKNCTIEQLFLGSYTMSLAYHVLKRKQYFDVREVYRKKIDEKIRRISNVDISIITLKLNKKLSSPIELDQQNKVWKQFSFASEDGVVIVDGDIIKGPFFIVKNENDKIPKGVVVVTKHLYQNIGLAINDIKGIICENGSLNAHVSILAREYGVPLIIQKSIQSFEDKK